VEIQNGLFDVDIGDRDISVWSSKNGVYSCVDTWNCLRTKFPEVPWCNVVWFPLAIPRHAFILWLVFRDALVTKDRMCWWGFEGNTLCRFCYGGQESIAHLFFHCSFCRRIWRNLMSLCLIQNPCVEWDDICYVPRVCDKGIIEIIFMPLFKRIISLLIFNDISRIIN
jgi:hypothetical protein